MKYYLIAILIAALLFTARIMFNHINPWISILFLLIVIGVAIKIIIIFNNKNQHNNK